MQRFVLLLSLTLVLSCSARGHMTVDPAAANVGSVQEIFVGTTRAADPENGYGSKRSEAVAFGRYDISVPPDRELGEISWPTKWRAADPRRDFLTTEEEHYDKPANFRADLKESLRQHGGEAVIFIHGYNNNFSEGLYRVAQFSHDLNLPGTVVHYSWPSAAIPFGYVYDRDSALFARDGLEDLMDQVAEAGAKRIFVVAHSMGSALTMETLRQAAIRGNSNGLKRVSGVILISPDIDVDVFRAQAKAMGTLPQPFVIFGSDRDRVLKLSAQMTGQTERLGSLTDISRVADLDVTFYDVRAFAEGAGHFTMGDSPALLSLLERITDVEGAFERERVARVGLLPGVIMTVQSATRVIISPVAPSLPRRVVR